MHETEEKEEAINREVLASPLLTQGPAQDSPIVTSFLVRITRTKMGPHSMMGGASVLSQNKGEAGRGGKTEDQESWLSSATS